MHERFPRLQWLIHQVVETQELILRVSCRLAELGFVSSTPPAPRSTLPHLAELQEQLERARSRCDRLTAELDRLGAIVMDRECGLVDLPVVIDDRAVVLCYQHGELAIAYWHEVNERCSARRPLSIVDPPAPH